MLSKKTKETAFYQKDDKSLMDATIAHLAGKITELTFRVTFSSL